MSQIGTNSLNGVFVHNCAITENLIWGHTGHNQRLERGTCPLPLPSGDATGRRKLFSDVRAECWCQFVATYYANFNETIANFWTSFTEGTISVFRYGIGGESHFLSTSFFFLFFLLEGL